MSRKKKEIEGSKGTPAWLATYGDMITLVLCFFILLYSFSSMDVLKWQQVVASVRGSLGVMDGGKTLDDYQLVGDGQPSSSPEERKLTEAEIDEYDLMKQEIQEMERLKQELEETVAQVENRIVVEVDQRGVILRFQDSVLFDSGKAVLKEEAYEILNVVGEILNDLENNIRVEGHTDNLPINTPQFPSNWELSTSRATNVLRFLLEFGIEPGKLSAVGYGEYHPIAENGNEDGRSKNRRVDIVILRDSLSEQEPSTAQGG